MICPIITAGRVAVDLITEYDSVNCPQDKCAWFDTKKGQCAILTLAQSSYSLKEAIQTLSQQISIKR